MGSKSQGRSRADSLLSHVNDPRASSRISRTGSVHEQGEPVRPATGPNPPRVSTRRRSYNFQQTRGDLTRIARTHHESARAQSSPSANSIKPHGKIAAVSMKLIDGAVIGVNEWWNDGTRERVLIQLLLRPVAYAFCCRINRLYRCQFSYVLHTHTGGNNSCGDTIEILNVE